MAQEVGKPVVWGKQISDSQGILYIDMATDKPVSLSSPKEELPDFPYTANMNELIQMFPQYDVRFYPLEKPPENTSAVNDTTIEMAINDFVNNIANKKPAQVVTNNSLLVAIEAYLDKLNFALVTASSKNKKIINSKIKTINEMLVELGIKNGQ